VKTTRSVRLLPTLRAECSFVALLGVLQAASCLRHTLPAFGSAESTTRPRLLGHPLKGCPLRALSRAGRFLQTCSRVLSFPHQQSGLHMPEKTLLLQRSCKSWTPLCAGVSGVLRGTEVHRVLPSFLRSLTGLGSV